MAHEFYTDANRIYVTKDGHSIFDTSSKSVSLFPIGTKITSSVSITFPDLLKGNAYIRDVSGPGGRGRSFITFLKQEWGYGITTDALDNKVNLAQTLIGTVPTGTDYVDIRINVQRTTVPDNSLVGVPFFVNFKENSWVQLQGGSCVAEIYTPIFRLFEFVLSGTNVYLRRYQTVGEESIPWIPSNNDSSISGWTWGSVSNNMGVRGNECVLGPLIDSRGPSPTGFDRRRAGSNDRANIPGRAYIIPGTSTTSGTFSDTSDFTSTYTGTVEIHPGRINN